MQALEHLLKQSGLQSLSAWILYVALLPISPLWGELVTLQSLSFSSDN